MPAPTKKPVRVARAFVDSLHLEPTVTLVAALHEKRDDVGALVPSRVQYTVEVDNAVPMIVTPADLETVLSLLRARA